MDIRTIVDYQQEYYQSGVTRDYTFRLNALKKLQQAVRAYESRISDALLADLGKQPFESYMAETGMVLDEVRFHIRHLRGWMRNKRVPTPLTQFHAVSFISPEPYGVALIMSPWNYPILLCLDPLIGAISGGNCAVIKPSAYTPATSQVIADLVAEIFPPEYVSVVQGGRQENTALLEQKFDYIFFTGSVAVGKVVMEAAAKHLTPVTLELGGKSPAIVDASADINLAAKRIAFGKLLNGGQTCVAPDYVLVEESLRDTLIQNFQEVLAEKFPNGNYADHVHIVNDRHYMEKKALLEGQTIAFGGKYSDARRKIEPTVLIDVDPESAVMQEEIFGPILPVLTWKKLDEAIEFVRSRPKPLALYLFTQDRAVEEKVLGSCSFGGGCINDTVIHLATPHMGFGGVGQSGMGSYHGKRSFDTFTHFRSIVRKSTWLDLPFRYFPYTDDKFRLIRKFLK
ncbi:MAG: aldehyde dehydrogenase [Anaerolineaceae bacterium]|jgi:aldehyde dehydrogenase (NAD+)|nr:aldehyde dehydrogenase [Anaerolineaceae bacterium]MDD4042618.1 aldehyde dehydrogenase [Anaerolineaceae bacterium]MDD4577833.1 aldehyde dehydrogenase [Anaerolineaceae bacterium]